MTTGVEIVGALLLADTDIGVSFSADRIKAGRLPDNTLLPALLIKEISTVEQQPLKRGAKTRTVDRVAVTVRAGNYRDMRLAIRQVRNCCAGRTGAIGGAQRVSILSAGAGPELDGPANSFERTQDFRVSYDA